jgi:hypothetical protein
MGTHCICLALPIAFPYLAICLAFPTATCLALHFDTCLALPLTLPLANCLATCHFQLALHLPLAPCPPPFNFSWKLPLALTLATWLLPCPFQLVLEITNCLDTCHLPCHLHLTCPLPLGQLPLALPTANCLSTCHMPCKLQLNLSQATCYLPCLTMQLSQASCYLVPPRLKHLAQHPILKYPQSTFLP